MKIGFAGAGKMASALARGWADGERRARRDAVLRLGLGRAAELAQRTRGEAVDSLAELAERSDAVVLAVKPGSLEIAAQQLGGRGDAIVSVLAATPVARLRELFRRGADRPGDADGRRRGPERRDLPRAARADGGRGRVDGC